MKCIRFVSTGEVQRVCEEIAQRQVSQLKAEFVPKHVWREFKAKKAAEAYKG